MRAPSGHELKTDQEVFVAVCGEVKMHSSDKRGFWIWVKISVKAGIKFAIHVKYTLWCLIPHEEVITNYD